MENFNLFGIQVSRVYNVPPPTTNDFGRAILIMIIVSSFLGYVNQLLHLKKLKLYLVRDEPTSTPACCHAISYHSIQPSVVANK